MGSRVACKWANQGRKEKKQESLEDDVTEPRAHGEITERLVGRSLIGEAFPWPQDAAHHMLSSEVL